MTLETKVVGVRAETLKVVWMEITKVLVGMGIRVKSDDYIKGRVMMLLKMVVLIALPYHL